MKTARSEPWLSVVMPLHDGAQWVETALASVAAELRDSSAVEVLVVDDGSTDDGPERVRAIARRYHWLRLIGPTRMGSWTATTNVGLAESRGAWATVLHQDDLWLPGRANAVEQLCSGKGGDAEIVFAGAQFVDDRGRRCGSWTPPLRSGPASRQRIAASLYVQNWACVPSVTFRRQSALSSGGFDESLWYTPDWDLWLRLVHDGDAVVTKRRISAFRLHAGSQTIAGSAAIDDFREQLDTVQRRHAWAATDQRHRAAGALSTKVNVVLAGARERGAARALLSIGRAAVGVGPVASTTFLGNSRIGQRSLARVRAGLLG